MQKIFLSLLLGLTLPALAQDGALDPTFGNNGKAYATAPSLNQSLSKTVVQGNGKVVIVGRAANCCGYDFSVARFNADGTPDIGFDGDGVVVTDFGSNVWDIANTVAVQPDGKIIAAGTSNQNFALARYNLDGSLDNTFDGDGKLTTVIGSNSAIYSMLLFPDGKIVVGGTSYNGNNRFTLARYHPDGSLDASFGTGGIAAYNPFSGSHIIYSLARQADGKIVASGSINNDFAIARYNADGTPDLSFNGTGYFLTDFFGNETAYSVAVQPDGRIIAAGVKDFEVLLMRVNANGSHDNSFNGTGILHGTYSTNGDAVYSVLIQGDGKIVVAGTSWSATTSDYLLVRYLANGALDPTFGTNGILKLDMGSSEAYATVAGWNNTLVVGGYSGSDWGVARLLNSSYPFALPVQLRSFTGNLQGGAVLLTWTTGTATSTAAFHIERSADGNRFHRIGEITAPGDAASDRSYSFTDGAPLPGTGFYRLKTVDIDGKAAYSPFISVRNSRTTDLVIFQNPVASDLRIQLRLPQAATVSIFNAAGAVVKQQAVAAGTVSITIPVGDLPPGTYWLAAPAKDGMLKTGFVKQ